MKKNIYYSLTANGDLIAEYLKNKDELNKL